MNYEVLSIDRLEEHEKLIKENGYLRDKINKAIDIINYYAIENEEYDKIYNQEELELLDILRGEDNEDRRLCKN